MTITDLISMWERVLGFPPAKEQFELWAMLHSLETIKHGSVKTAIKNQKLDGAMSQDHRERFASKVMSTRTNDPQKAAGRSPDQRTSVNPPVQAETGYCAS
jgi:hypothetical protein